MQPAFPQSETRSRATPVRVAYVVSHPIQYQAPLLRRLAQEPDVDLTVLFGSDFSTKSFHDEGFGVQIEWDIPLLEGYKHEFLPALRDTGTEGTFTPISRNLLGRLAQGSAGEPFDLVWVHGYATVNQMQAILAARFLGLPVIIRADSWLSDRPRTGPRLFAKQLLFVLLKRLVSAILVTGTLTTRYWRHYFGPAFPLFLMPYAVDNDRFHQQAQLASASRPALRAELNLEPARPVILFASKLQTRKHCDDLVSAFLRLRLPGPAPYLLIVGDGEERANLERQANGHPDIRFLGFRNQSELPRFFDLADVFVLPARHEPWGLIVNEVMNAATPVILTTDVGCGPDLVTDGVEGFLYPPRDVDALVRALETVLSSPAVSERMGQAALARIRTWGFDEDIAGLRAAFTHVSRKPGRTS